MAGNRTGSLCALMVFAFVSLAVVTPARAITVLRDPDIENALKQLSLPLIRAAGLGGERINLIVLRDSSLNAFVFDAGHVLIHSGLILRMESASELQAVVAHELAHIVNGHIPRRLSNLRAAGGATQLGMLMALAIGAATGNADAAAGVAVGSISSAERVFLRHTRAEEASADQSALRYLSQAGVDPGAMATLLLRFRGQEVLSAIRQDPYVRSHPLTQDRIRAVKGYAAAYGGTPRDPTEADRWFARARATAGKCRYTAGKGRDRYGRILGRVMLERGRQREDPEGRVFLHRGIAARQFQRRFVLAEGIEVRRAHTENGLLHIDLARPEPEVRTRTIEIDSGS